MRSTTLVNAVLTDLLIAGVAAGSQLAVVALHVRRRQVEQRQPARLQVPAGKGPLDPLLPLAEPIHRGIDLIGGRVLDAQIVREGGVVPPAGGGQLGRRPQHPSHRQRQRQVPLPAGLTEQAGQA
jgi:hypothetical protein